MRTHDAAPGQLGWSVLHKSHLGSDHGSCLLMPQAASGSALVSCGQIGQFPECIGKPSAAYGVRAHGAGEVRPRQARVQMRASHGDGSSGA